MTLLILLFVPIVSCFSQFRSKLEDRVCRLIRNSVRLLLNQLLRSFLALILREHARKRPFCPARVVPVSNGVDTPAREPKCKPVSTNPLSFQ